MRRRSGRTDRATRNRLLKLVERAILHIYMWVKASTPPAKTWMSEMVLHLGQLKVNPARAAWPWLLGAALAVSAAAGQASAPSGEVLYSRHCLSCHGAALQGSAHGGPLRGEQFLARWGGRSRGELLAYNLSTMPPGGARLTAAEHGALVEFLFARNDAGGDLLPVAAAEGSGEESAFDSWSGAAGIDEIARSRSAFRNREIEGFQPVSDARLRAPPPGDWLHWRRTQDGQAHSPLKRIDRTNVDRLQLAWAVTMREGSNQVTPLVHDGVLYLTHPDNLVQALDAATGELIWEYAYQYPPAARTLGGPLRNLAIHGDKLFLATYDAALVAIDARTGEPIWRTVKADYRKGYTHTSGPILGGGLLLSGVNGCERYQPDGCFVTGHDPATGRELWRTSTIALPGEPGDETWGGLAAEFRAGGDVWIAGSYDPVLGLYYVGTSQAKPWVAASRGLTVADAALYTNSTVALHGGTGAIAWHFQHAPGETIDMETGFERVLIDRHGENRLYTVGKDGILWRLDRRSGRYLGHLETLPQNLFSHIDSRTGRVSYRRDIAEAGIGDPIQACPGIYGGHNWQSMAYSEANNLLIVPLHRLCADLVGRAVPKVAGEGGFGGDSRSYPMPGSDGKLGMLVAVDADRLEPVWTHTQRAMFMTGALATGGGLVFIGDLDRYFKAFDADTGQMLWQTRLGAPTHGYPVTYLANGEQYVAVPTGMGVFRALTAAISPDIHQPSGGQALYVFKLPSAKGPESQKGQ